MQPYAVKTGLFNKNKTAMKNSILIICLSLFANLSWSQCEGFEVTVTLNNPTCHGFSDGSVNMTASGGNTPYDFTLMDIDGTIYDCPGGSGPSLAAGCYVVIVTDSLDCSLLDTVCLIDPDPITVDLSIIPPTYSGACDGIVIADAVYGYQGAYEALGYYWDIPGAIPGSEVLDVCAGEYTLTVNDEFGCSGVVDFALGSLAELPVNANQEIAVFLNRSNGELIVRNPTVKILNIKVLNLAGQTVFDSNINSNNTSYSPNLNKGIYVYTVESKQGIIQSGKLVF
jgi:hypothetical protein